MTRALRIVAILAVVLVACLIGTQQVDASTGHCPNYNGHPNKVESVTDGDLNNIRPPAGSIICVKGSNEATGIITADGLKTLFAYLNNGHDVSYYIWYGRENPPRTPPATPSPSPSPSTTPTPSPSSTPTSTPTTTSSPSATPTSPVTSPSPSTPTTTNTPTVSPSPITLIPDTATRPFDQGRALLLTVGLLCIALGLYVIATRGETK